MKTLLKTAVIMGVIALMPSHILAQSAASIDTYSPPAATFIKKRYNIKGTWKVAEENGQQVIKFDDDFRTKGGPDLKLYLSTETISELESGNVENTSVKLGVLKSNRGAQSYIIPEDIKLSDYKSVVIHCEAFTVLWGGFDIATLP